MLPVHEVFALGIAGVTSVAVPCCKTLLPEKDIGAIRKGSQTRI
jgi:hypothetical protein